MIQLSCLEPKNILTAYKQYILSYILFQPPIPGMRPPMGAGMQTPVQAKGSGVLGILMPVYTIGIVVFFAYTIIRVIIVCGRITFFQYLYTFYFER